MKNGWSTKFAVLLTAVSLLAAGPVAFAGSYEENGPGGRRGRKQCGQEQMYKDLGLSQEQQDKLKARREGGREQRKAQHEQIKTKMRALHEEIGKPETTRVSVEPRVAEINALKAQMFSQRIDDTFALKEVLTPEQFAKFREHHKKMMKRERQGWQKKGMKWQKGPKGPEDAGEQGPLPEPAG